MNKKSNNDVVEEFLRVVLGILLYRPIGQTMWDGNGDHVALPWLSDCTCASEIEDEKELIHH